MQLARLVRGANVTSNRSDLQSPSELPIPYNKCANEVVRKKEQAWTFKNHGERFPVCEKTLIRVGESIFNDRKLTQ